MPKLTAPEKEEVVVEPDLPVEEPSPTPAGPVEEEPTPEEASEEAPEEPELSESEKALLEAQAWEALSLEEKGAAVYYAQVAAMSPEEPVYVAGNRAPRLKVGHYVLKPGEIVPGAHAWLRREAYERLGRIERR